MKLRKMMRAPFVKRWGIVNVTREQNIAEHSFMVALLSGELYAYLISDEDMYDQAVVRELYELAIWHDMPEVVTGDINSAFKETACWGTERDYEICPMLEYAVNGQSHYWQEFIVKICDTVEAIRFLSLHGVESSDTARVREYLRNKLTSQILKAEECHPQFDWSKAVTDLMIEVES